MLLQSTAHANTGISVYIDGVQLSTDQAPVMVQGRVMVPLRAIFESLNATVKWDQKSQTATAIKGNTTIVLKIKSKVATINNKAVTLDVPAQSIKGRTMVPTRFVSEALGQEVGWNSKTKRVTITSGGNNSSEGKPNAVSYVSLRDIGSAGDARDLEVSFSKSSNETAVDHYRVFIVKANDAARFDLAAAQKVASGNFSTLLPTGSDQILKLLTSSRDVDGTIIKANQSYVAFVLAVGKSNAGNNLSRASSAITLDSGATVAAASNVKATDISDNGDGRDISVSFTRPQNDSNIGSYRVIVVKTKDLSRFNVSTANSLASQSYVVVNKSGNSTTLTGTLTSNTRDSSGELIKNGVAYNAFVLSVSNTTGVSSQLSSGTASFTLSASAIPAPVITQVTDQSDYGDGRDVRVNFNKISDESKISGYRIFVVKDSNSSSFNQTKANVVSSSNYTTVTKNGNSNYTSTLNSGTRDTDGATLRSGVNYRVFVMAVGSGQYLGNYTLSSASSVITLLSNVNVPEVTNISVSDINDNNDGRDLYISYNRPSNESNISEYRIFVIKASNVGSFNLDRANTLSSSYYTRANVGYNFNQTLSSGSKDVDGAYIQNGVSYRVVVLSVGKGNYSGVNKLSSYSSTITLTSSGVGKVSNITVNDVNDYGDGRDLEVFFTRASNESNINHYRIFVVKSSNYSNFTLAKANVSDYYTSVNKTGGDIRQSLFNGTKDVDGHTIQNGVSYRVYVLSVSNGSNTGSNVISSVSSSITLSNNSSVLPISNLGVKDVGDNNNGADLEVSFKGVANETSVNHYRILVVKATNSGSFDLSKANGVGADRYTQVNKTGNGNVITQVLNGNAKDVDGDAIRNDVKYNVFVLTKGNGSTNAISAASSEITLTTSFAAEPTSQPSASVTANTGNFSDINVSFNKVANENKIAEYRILVVPSSQVGSFKLQDANNVTVAGNYMSITPSASNVNVSLQNSKDVYGNAVNTDTTYQVVVLTVAKTGNPSDNALSPASNQVKINPNPDHIAVSAVQGVAVTSDATGISVSFTEPSTNQNIAAYAILAVPSGSTLDLAGANSAYLSGKTLPIPKGQSGLHKLAFDVNGAAIDNTQREYVIYVLSIPDMVNAKIGALSSSYTATLYVAPPAPSPPLQAEPIQTPVDQIPVQQ